MEENKSTAYGKIATAISSMQKRGETITLPLINSTDFGFVPDEGNNRIIYSIKAINGIGDDVARLLIQNRPYTSMEDFYKRMIETSLVKTSQMVKLIKAGCFVELHSEDRRETMRDFLSRYVVNPLGKLTLSQLNKLMEFDSAYHFIPDGVKESIQHKCFKEYVFQDEFFYKNHINPGKKLPKAGYHDRWFKLDNVAMPFFQSNYTESSVEAVDEEYYVISEKKFKKENDKFLAPLKEWLSEEETLNQYNDCLLAEAWENYASGSVAKWEMESLSIYCTQEHELSHMDNGAYGVVDFFQEPETPQAYEHYTRRIKQGDGYITKQFPKNRIVRIAGTVLDKNKNRHMISLLTTTGVVNVKFDKGQFAYYDKQISEKNENGTKTVLEKPWFTRGNKLLVCGFRRDDQFVAKKYADTVWKHTCNLITCVNADGELEVQMERR